MNENASHSSLFKVFATILFSKKSGAIISFYCLSCINLPLIKENDAKLRFLNQP